MEEAHSVDAISSDFTLRFLTNDDDIVLIGLGSGGGEGSGGMEGGPTENRRPSNHHGGRKWKKHEGDVIRGTDVRQSPILLFGWVWKEPKRIQTKRSFPSEAR